MTLQLQRIDALLIDQATGELSVAERDELDALLRQHPEIDPYAYERIAAKVFMAAACKTAEAMPAHLYSKIIGDGQQTLEEND